jgi:hypothetical protein
MTYRRTLIVLAFVLGVSYWCWCRSGEKQAQAMTADPVYSLEEQEPGAGGTHDDAFYRYRTSQSTHWRHVAIGKGGATP